ncbi:hypothetical protein ACTA71_011985 [Dictyostelium dimigraforme]
MKNKFYFLSYFIISIIFSFIKSGDGMFFETSKDKYYQVEYFNNKECDGDVVQYQAILIGTEYCFAIPNFQLDCTGAFENSTRECYYSHGCYCGEKCRNYVNLNQCIVDNYFNISFRIVYQMVNYKEKDFCIISETHGVEEIPDETITRYRLNGFQAFKKEVCIFEGNVDCDIEGISFYTCNNTDLSIILLKNFINTAISYTNWTSNSIGQHYFYPGDPNFLIKSIKNGAFKLIGFNLLLFLITFILNILIVF